MIEIVYNGIVFELLIMETKPEGTGISLLDTDLEVRASLCSTRPEVSP